MLELTGLDIETEPCEGQPLEYALQPWRAQAGTARISLLCAVGLRGAHTLVPGYDSGKILDRLAGTYVCAYNAVFDVGWLIACGFEAQVRKIKWIDAAILHKFYVNGQEAEHRPAESLLDAAQFWCRDAPWLAEFVEIKSRDTVAGTDPEYWRQRVHLDALATVVIADRALRTLPPRTARLAQYSMRCIIPVAKSWVRGVRVAPTLAESMYAPATEEMRRLELELGVSTPPVTKKELRTARSGWQPSRVLASPKQLGELLYDQWGLTCERETDSGNRSADKTALTYLADHDDRVLSVLRWRELNTRLSKFVLGIPKAVKYLGSDVTHAGPKLFSTYTGRMTYRSKSGSRGPASLACVGVPQHQWPRAQAMRKLIIAHAGDLLLEFDAAGQEGRLMAAASMDVAMLRLFNAAAPYDDFHSYTASRIGGMSFEEVLARKQVRDPLIVGAEGLRNAAKFINLSKQYRASNKKLRLVARVQYGLDKDIRTITQWSSIYSTAYPGVERYWGDAIRKARTLGYAETFGGRRFEITRWGRDDKWGSESSAINFPIQGAGADMKELAIATLDARYPEIIFSMDMHDGLFFSTPEAPHVPELVADITHTLNTLDYKTAWDWDAPVLLPWDAGYGRSWGDIRK